MENQAVGLILSPFPNLLPEGVYVTAVARSRYSAVHVVQHGYTEGTSAIRSPAVSDTGDGQYRA